MADSKVHMIAGGTARWGRQLPVDAKTNTVCYEADIITKLSVWTPDEHVSYHRSTYIGMDEVEADGRVPTGFGRVRLEDIRTGDLLLGRVDWWEEEGRDLGTFSFDSGTGFWENASGRIDVVLQFCTLEPDGDLSSGDPVAVMGFLEGTGQFSFAE